MPGRTIEHEGVLRTRQTNEATVNYLLASQHYARGAVDSTVHYLKAALRYDPASAHAHQLLGEIYLLRNAGTPSEPLFELPRQLHCYGEPIAFTIHGPHAWAGDFNGDGKPDLLGCTEWSVYPFYAHAALEMDEHPHYQINIVEGA